MKKTLKYIGIGVLVLGAFMFWVFGGDSEEAINNMDKTAGAYDESDYYTLTLDDESEVDILVPYCISSGRVKNLRDEREHDIFASIYAYDHEDVYLSDIPDDELTVRELLEAPYAVGTLFNFSLNVLNTDGAGQIIGELQGCDDSIGDLMTVDSTYLDDNIYDLMEGDVVYFDAVYAGLDTTSDPLFIGLGMSY